MYNLADHIGQEGGIVLGVGLSLIGNLPYLLVIK
jgi:hypothetical protein